MAVDVRINPIAPDLVDEWRAFVAELTGARRIEWAESNRRCGISRHVISIAGSEPEQVSVVVVEADDPAAADRILRESSHDFDVWLRGRLDELLGDRVPVSVLFDGAPRRGPWRGMPKPGRRT